MIEIKDLTKIFILGGEKIIAVDNISLSIPDGSFLIIMGPSGSGKSTLMQIIGGLQTPDKGRVIVNGIDISKLNDRELSGFRNKNIGFIFQNFNLQQSYTALENVEMPLIFSGIPEKERKKRAENLLCEFGMDKRLNHRPAQMSGGEMQRVAIARALVNNSSILLADEPTGNVDRENSIKIINSLREINIRFKVTVIIVTHDYIFKEYADNVINLSNGRINAEKNLYDKKI
ncbi:MAG TPA: ABC transporter ATP-binding protein [bacterium]|nr:ABC transporter ATP-binding protein [bacterium]